MGGGGGGGLKKEMAKTKTDSPAVCSDLAAVGTSIPNWGEGLHNTWKTIQGTKTGQPLCCQRSLFHPLSQPITQLMDPIYLNCSSTEFLESTLRGHMPKVIHRTMFNRLFPEIDVLIKIR